jgi:pimeloyl-ACP methyl ester carboxylesterase
MTSRRPNTRLRVLDGGHAIHLDDPAGFADVVKEYLRDL